MFTAVMLAAATVAAKGEVPTGASVLDCAGPIAPTATAASLARTYGRTNVRSEDLAGAEGETARGTVLFPSDPARRLEIWWTDEKRRRSPSAIVVSDASKWRVRVPGRAPLQLGLRASLAEVEAANGRAFDVIGFGWDYGGYPDFAGGKLDAPKRGCSLILRFSPDAKAKDADVDRVSGEGSFRSTDPALKRTRPYLSSITVNYED